MNFILGNSNRIAHALRFLSRQLPRYRLTHMNMRNKHEDHSSSKNPSPSIAPLACELNHCFWIWLFIRLTLHDARAHRQIQAPANRPQDDCHRSVRWDKQDIHFAPTSIHLCRKRAARAPPEEEVHQGWSEKANDDDANDDNNRLPRGEHSQQTSTAPCDDVSM